MAYERANIQRMAGYVPGEQPADRGVVKLNTNENPYPPSGRVLDALRSITADDLRRYPPPTAADFRRIAAEVHGLEPANVIATNGGDELLRLAVTTFVEPGAPIGMAEPSYSLYPVLAAVQGCPVVSAPLNADWSLPGAGEMARRMNGAGVRLTLLVNPHAPSGRLTDAAALADLAERLEGLLLIDEAYADFVDPAAWYDSAPLVRRFDNVLVLRSLSKGYSLAGLRFGYGLGPAGLIEPMLTKTRDSYNTDVVSQRLAAAALADRQGASRTWAAVRTERVRLAAELGKLGIGCVPSESNFLLATVDDSMAGGAAGVYESLKRRRILVRYFEEDRLRDKLRITVGTPEHNDALIAALDALMR